MSENNDKLEHAEKENIMLHKNLSKDRATDYSLNDNTFVTDNNLTGITGGFLGVDWTDGWQEKYKKAGIIHEQHKFHKDRYYCELTENEARKKATLDEDWKTPTCN